MSFLEQSWSEVNEKPKLPGSLRYSFKNCSISSIEEWLILNVISTSVAGVSGGCQLPLLRSILLA